jgi:hypothetical protein
MDKLSRWIANHLPRDVIYFAAIRLMAHATQGRWGTQVVPDLTVIVALDRWAEEE